MKKALKILSISVSILACNNRAENEVTQFPDSLTQQEAPGRKPIGSAGGNASNLPDPTDKLEREREIARQVTAALIASKKEVNILRTEVSDSLTKSGLAASRRSLFSKTIRELESTSELINKELENILVSDLNQNRDKLSGIIRRMKGSERELGNMITRLDRINGYLQVATTLIETLTPIPIPAQRPERERH